MKPKKISLLFTLFLLRTTCVWGGGERDGEDATSSFPQIRTAGPSREELIAAQVEGMQDSIQAIMLSTRKSIEAAGSSEKVILVGPTGAGKTVLLNIIANNPLTAAKGPTRKLRLETAANKYAIGHTGVSKTTFPSAWTQRGGPTCWDLPGLGDTHGPTREIINAFIFREASAGLVKILLAVSESSFDDRAKLFLELMNDITQTYSVDDLKQNLVLIITKQGSGHDARESIKELLRLSNEEVHNLTKDVRDLLEHLIKDEETLIPYFPAPQKEGPYAAEEVRAKIIKSLASRKFIKNPTVLLKIPSASLIYVDGLAKRLKQDTGQTLKTILETISSVFKAYVKDYKAQGNLEAMKKALQEVSMARAITRDILGEDHEEKIESFVSSLHRFGEKEVLENLKGSIKTLMFLRTLKEDLDIPLDTWANNFQLALETTQKSILKLAKKIGKEITHSIHEVVSEQLLGRCRNLIRPGEEQDNINKLKAIRSDIAVIQRALRTYPEESLPLSVLKLDGFFLNREENILKSPLESLIFIKRFQDSVVLPRKKAWASAFQLVYDQIEHSISMLEHSISMLEHSISMQKQILISKEERKHLEEEQAKQAEERSRLERERFQREEDERRLACETQARLKAEKAQLEVEKALVEISLRLVEEQKRVQEAKAARELEQLNHENAQRQETEEQKYREAEGALSEEKARLEAEKAQVEIKLRLVEEQKRVQEAKAAQELEEFKRENAQRQETEQRYREAERARWEEIQRQAQKDEAARKLREAEISRKLQEVERTLKEGIQGRVTLIPNAPGTQRLLLIPKAGPKQVTQGRVTLIPNTPGTQGLPLIPKAGPKQGAQGRVTLIPNAPGTQRLPLIPKASPKQGIQGLTLILKAPPKQVTLTPNKADQKLLPLTPAPKPRPKKTILG